MNNNDNYTPLEQMAGQGNADNAPNKNDGDFWAHCADCKHEWVLVKTPCPIEEFTKACNNCTCPKCHGANIKVFAKEKENTT